MAARAEVLSVEMRARDRATRDIDKVKRSIGGLGKAAKAAGAALAALAAGEVPEQHEPVLAHGRGRRRATDVGISKRQLSPWLK